MREIREIIIHCTDTPAGTDYPLSVIEGWHKKRGFRSIGYHYLIHPDGSVEPARPIERAGAHCFGHNDHSIGIAYIGGKNKWTGKHEDTRTIYQKNALRILVANLRDKFPAAKVYGHNEFSKKDCPCFNVQKEFRPYELELKKQGEK